MVRPFEEKFQVPYILWDSIRIYKDSLQSSTVIGDKENYIMKDLLITKI